MDTGVYELSARGKDELVQYPELVKHYAALLGGGGRKGKKA